jgi:glucokinase
VNSLVFDVGGTKTRVGLFDGARSAVIRSVTAPTPNHLDFPSRSFEELRTALLELMQRLGSEFAKPQALEQVSVAFAGPVDEAGNVLAAPTIWGTRLAAPHPLLRDLRETWPGAGVTLMNDVTAAGYRYLTPSSRDFCIVTVSSGIGQKVFLSGRPVVGKDGSGGELGHLQVDDSPGAPTCECGGRGHVGALASGRGVLQQARLAVGKAQLTSAELVSAFHRGEPWAVEAVGGGAAQLGFALASLHLGVGLTRFVLFGGFALALGEPYRALVARAAAVRCWDGRGDWNGWVELGVNDDDAGLIGAGLALAREEGAR